GITSVTAINPSQAPAAPAGFQIVSGLTYDVATTASISGSTTVCFIIPWITDAPTFARVRLLHGENGAFVDRTLLAGPWAPNFRTTRVCGRVSSLTPFAIALQSTPPPVNHSPVCTTASATTSELWPPDHRLVTVQVQGVADSDNDTVTITVGGIYQD